jgi:signal transduction histidine kinase
LPRIRFRKGHRCRKGRVRGESKILSGRPGKDAISGNRQERGESLKTEAGLEEKERSTQSTSLEGKNSPEEEILRWRTLQEEVLTYRKKCERLTEYLNESVRVVQKLETQTLRTPRIEMMGKAMVAGLAHDLRNPLAVIHSCSQSCLEAERLSRSLRKNLVKIQESSQKANSLLRQFLDFVKSGLNWQSTNIHELLLRAWDSACLDAKSQPVNLETRFSPDLPFIFADPEKLERVFVNLLLNALRAAPPGGTVAIQTRLLGQGKYVQIEIIDNGPGIPVSQRERVFEPFFSTQKDGMGLGLFLCRSFIQDHQGKISIDDGEAGGTKVTVKLPMIPENSGAEEG